MSTCGQTELLGAAFSFVPDFRTVFVFPRAIRRIRMAVAVSFRNLATLLSGSAGLVYLTFKTMRLEIGISNNALYYTNRVAPLLIYRSVDASASFRGEIM